MITVRPRGLEICEIVQDTSVSSGKINTLAIKRTPSFVAHGFDEEASNWGVFRSAPGRSASCPFGEGLDCAFDCFC